MARRRYEILDIEGNRLRARDWVRTDSTCEELHVIPKADKRRAFAAASCVDGLLRLFFDPEQTSPQVDISEVRVGARAYKIRWAGTEELREYAIRYNIIEPESEQIPSAMIVHEQLVILISETLKLMPLRALETLFHEMTHILEDVCGIGADGGWPEGLVDALAVQQVNMLVQSGFIDLSRISIAGVPFQASIK